MEDVSQALPTLLEFESPHTIFTVLSNDFTHVILRTRLPLFSRAMVKRSGNLVTRLASRCLVCRES